MPTPPKPYEVISMEGRSHRTKKELEARKQAESQLLSGEKLKERKEVKENPAAHREFLRINKILKNIGKNDAIYEPVLNRFCMLQAECLELQERREEIHQITMELRASFNAMDQEEKEEKLLDFSRELARMTGAMLNCDKQLATKRKMLLDIEKENIMTIASALRSIPKKQKEEEEDDPMMALLKQRVQ